MPAILCKMQSQLSAKMLCNFLQKGLAKNSGLTIFHPFADGTCSKELYKIRTGNMTGVDRVIESITERRLRFTQVDFLVCAHRHW